MARLIDLDKIKPIEFPSVDMDGLDVVRYLNTLPTAVTIFAPTEKGRTMFNNENPNIIELCFHNGEKHIKEKLIGKLQELGETMSCVTVAQVIKIVEDL